MSSTACKIYLNIKGKGGAKEELLQEQLEQF